MRFYWLDRLPVGLFLDEATEGLDALSLLKIPMWKWPVFFLAVNGREPLFVYLLAVAQAVAGTSQLVLRFVPALIGVLFTPALIWLAWEMAPALRVSQRRRFALWSGLAVLGLLWSQMQARIALRNGLFLLLEIVVWAGLWRAWRVNRLIWWLLAGVMAGLAFYTYIPVRVWPLAFIPMLSLVFLRYRASLSERWPGMVAALVAGCLVATPLGLYFLRHPDSFSMRTSQVGVLNQGLGVIWYQVKAVLGMAFVRGDGNIRVNLPGRPVLDPLMVLPFLIGALMTLRRFRNPAALFLLAQLAVMLLPTLLSEDPPNFGRAIGALPVFVLFIAVGLDQLAAWCRRVGPAFTRAASVLGWGLLLASAVITWRAYFVSWARLPELFAWWDQGYTELAGQIAASLHSNLSPNGEAPRVYISPQGSANPSVLFGLTEKAAFVTPHGFDGLVCVRVATDRAADYYFLAGGDNRGEKLIRSYVPGISSEVAVADPYGREWAVVLHQTPSQKIVLPEMTRLPVVLDDGIELMGYWLSQQTVASGDRLYVRLFWRVTAVPRQSYTAFVHLNLLGRAGGPFVAGTDALPGNGACPTNDWQPGEVIVDELQLAVPAAAPVGDYSLVVGLYRLETMQRLQVAGSTTDQITLAPVSKVR